MNIFLDIETCPSQLPNVRDDFIKNIQAPGQYKKPDSIAEWLKENAASEGDAAWRKTSFDGGLGHVCVIGMAIDDFTPVSFYSAEWVKDESKVLRDFYQYIDDACRFSPASRPRFIGHNLIEFDLRFLFQRSVVLGVKPSIHIPFNCKPWDDGVYDTMQKWGARAGGSLDKITKACGLSGKGDIDGSMVWDYVNSGRLEEIAEYCRDDVNLTRSLFNRMTFNGC